MWKFTAGEIPACSARLSQGPFLVGGSPRFSVVAQKDPISSEGSAVQPERYPYLVGQHDVANFTFAKADRQRTAIAVEIFAFQAGELGVAAARKQAPPAPFSGSLRGRPRPTAAHRRR